MIEVRRTLTVLAVLTAVVASAVQAAPAAASAPKPLHPVDPHAPSRGHAYRHGVIPTVHQQSKIRASERADASVAATTGPETLSYGGGVDGIGVTSGKPKVYLVFWGSQWGTQSTDSNGNLTFSSDSYGGAPKLQMMFKGLGTGNERWSGVMTQYCDGSAVAKGATSCPSNAAHVGYPSGGALAGVWYDNSAAEPQVATAGQLGAEAVKAAGHFGNATSAANRYAQYVILSAKGLNPDNYQTANLCAWHDWNGDVGVSSAYGDVAFTNMPYVMDMGSDCGMNFVNAGSAGYLDGYTMVEGHEYAETITDQNPAGGWTNQTGDLTYNTEENADECVWIGSGQGAAADVVTANGSYAMQSTWSNDTNRCDISHPVVSRLVGAQSGRCLDVPGYSTVNGTQLDVWDCNGGSNQLFSIAGSGTITVYAGSNQKCVDGYGGGTSAGTIVDIYTCNGGANQNWVMHADGSITNAQSGLCLDVYRQATGNGAKIDEWSCNGGANQRWALA